MHVPFVCVLYSIQDYGERRVRRILIRNRCQLGERTFSLFFQGAATGFIVFRCLGAFTGRLYTSPRTHADTHYHRIGRFESLVTERRGYYFSDAGNMAIIFAMGPQI